MEMTPEQVSRPQPLAEEEEEEEEEEDDDDNEILL
jgi:hypothetical protein